MSHACHLPKNELLTFLRFLCASDDVSFRFWFCSWLILFFLFIQFDPPPFSSWCHVPGTRPSIRMSVVSPCFLYSVCRFLLLCVLCFNCLFFLAALIYGLTVLFYNFGFPGAWSTSFGRSKCACCLRSSFSNCECYASLLR